MTGISHHLPHRGRGKHHQKTLRPPETSGGLSGRDDVCTGFSVLALGGLLPHQKYKVLNLQFLQLLKLTMVAAFGQRHCRSQSKKNGPGFPKFVDTFVSLPVFGLIHPHYPGLPKRGWEASS